MVEISHLLLVINCSLNFPIYFIASGSSFSDIFSSFHRGRSSFSPNRWRPRSCSLSVTSKSTLMIPLQLLTPTQPEESSTANCLSPSAGSCPNP